MADDIRPEDEVSEKQIDDFYSYVAGPTQGNPFRGAEHDIFHLAAIEYLEQARVVLAVLDR